MFGFDLFGGGNDSDIDDLIGQAIAAIDASTGAAMQKLDQYVNTGISEAKDQYAVTAAIAKPFSDMAKATMEELGAFLGIGGGSSEALQQKLRSTPGYQFQLSEGQNALERSLASKGLTVSGSALKAAQQYGQDYAQGYFQNHLANLSGFFGQTSVFPQQQMIQSNALGQGILGARTQQGSTAAQVQSNAGIAKANAISTLGQMQINRNDSMMSGLGNLAGQVIGGFF